MRRSFLLVSVVSFLIGCAVAPYVVPRLAAQDDDDLQWDYMCFDEAGATDVTQRARRAGRDGWEMVASGFDDHQSIWCFKRPL